MASLNELSEILAERAGRQLDVPFQEEMKVLIQIWRSRLLRDTLQNNKRDRMYFRQYIEVPLIEVNISELPGFPDLRVMRTECRLPDPLRANGILFDYVGSPDKVSAFKLFTELHEIIPSLDGKYTGRRPKGLWLNNYIYVWNALGLPYLGTYGIYDDPREAKDFTCNCGCDVCFDDDMPYPVSFDIQQKIIQAILSTELKDRIKPDTKTVEVDGDNKA